MWSGGKANSEVLKVERVMKESCVLYKKDQKRAQARHGSPVCVCGPLFIFGTTPPHGSSLCRVDVSAKAAHHKSIPHTHRWTSSKAILESESDQNVVKGL